MIRKGLQSGLTVLYYITFSTVLAVNSVRNSSGALDPAGTIIKPNPAAEQRGIISNGVKEAFIG